MRTSEGHMGSLPGYLIMKTSGTVFGWNVVDKLQFHCDIDSTFQKNPKVETHVFINILPGINLKIRAKLSNAFQHTFFAKCEIWKESSLDLLRLYRGMNLQWIILAHLLRNICWSMNLWHQILDTHEFLWTVWNIWLCKMWRGLLWNMRILNIFF